MTSVTTLIVMVPMLIMSGPAIREFVVPLMVGIIAGAYSSIAMCSPLYYEFSKRKKVSKYEKQVQAANKKEEGKETAGRNEGTSSAGTANRLTNSRCGKECNDADTAAAAAADQENSCADPAKVWAQKRTAEKQKNTMDQKRSKTVCKGK